MVRLSRLETKTQEVTLLMTVVATLSVIMGGVFYLSLSGPKLQLITGQFGASALRSLFDFMGLAVFLLAFLSFWLGRFVLIYTTELKEILRLYPRILFRLLVQSWVISGVASYLTIVQIHWTINSPAGLHSGLGGSLGQFLGGNFYHLFGLFGSLTLVTSLIIIISIISGQIQLVSLLLHLEDLVINGLEKARRGLTRIAKLTMARLGQDWEFAREGARASELAGVGARGLAAGAASSHQSVGSMSVYPDPGLRSQLPMGEVMAGSRPLDLPPPPQVPFNFVAPDFVSTHIATQAKPTDPVAQETAAISRVKSKTSRSRAAKSEALDKATELAEEVAQPGAEIAQGNLPLVEVRAWRGRYQAPDAALLKRPAKARVPSDAEIRGKCAELEERLASFQIKGKVTDAHVGASLTMYEFQPEPGVKVSKITSLTDDLALMLGASSLRILAPIPGKKTLGIEVPNEDGQAVMFAALLPTLQKEAKEAELPIALGVDVHNKAMVADLSSMPHLLVAGTTGSGKSVFMNSLIMSLLYMRSPKNLRFLMIDPKMIELSPYNGIPHLLKPVVTDVNEAKELLVWAEQEMDRRYQMFSDTQARNITSFNEKVASSTKSQFERRAGRKFSWDWQEMPYIVIVIDELADLMLTQGREVEVPITRIAQKARASGIHMVIATQRPSSDIVTGLIKTNFPTRIAFKVSSAIDSRTILDDSGAEKLLGKGDMLFLPNGKSVQRIQGCFLGESEVKKVVQVLNTAVRPG